MSIRSKRPAALTFGPYQLIERLRGPSLTERHRALGPDGRFVVLHVVRPELARDFAFRALFQVEAAKARDLVHPNVARVVDFGEVDGRWYLAVAEVEGEDLATRLASARGSGDRLSRPDVRGIVRDVSAALAYAHERGVVHGDVRPGNVIVTKDHALLTGFALARSLRTGPPDRVAVAAFAPAYMAPEQSEGKAPDRRSDVYALGVLAYELFTGRPPYVSETPLAVLLAHGRDPLPLPSAVDPAIGAPIERVLLRALAVDPAARHADPLSFASSLEEALEQDERAPTPGFAVVRPTERPAATPSPVLAWLRAPYVTGAAAIALLLVGIVIGLAVARPAPVASVPVGTAPVAPTVPPTPVSTVPPPPRPTLPVIVQPAPAPITLLNPPGGITPSLPTGPAIFTAKLDGSSELGDVRVFSGGPSDAAIRTTRGAIEAEVARPRGGAEAFFPITARDSFAGEFTVTVPTGSEALLTWALRRDGDAAYLLRLDAAAETLSLLYDDGVRMRETLAPQWRITQLRTGRPIQIAFLIRGSEMTVYMDGGRPVMFVSDARIKHATLPPDIFVGDEGGVGIIRITSARLIAAP